MCVDVKMTKLKSQLQPTVHLYNLKNREMTLGDYKQDYQRFNLSTSSPDVEKSRAKGMGVYQGHLYPNKMN